MQFDGDEGGLTLFLAKLNCKDVAHEAFAFQSETRRGRCRFEEQDVAMMSVALRAVGLHLRAADPAAMRVFLVAVHARAAVAAAQGTMSPRAQVPPSPTPLHCFQNDSAVLSIRAVPIRSFCPLSLFALVSLSYAHTESLLGERPRLGLSGQMTIQAVKTRLMHL